MAMGKTLPNSKNLKLKLPSAKPLGYRIEVIVEEASTNDSIRMFGRAFSIAHDPGTGPSSK